MPRVHQTEPPKQAKKAPHGFAKQKQKKKPKAQQSARKRAASAQAARQAHQKQLRLHRADQVHDRAPATRNQTRRRAHSTAAVSVRAAVLQRPSSRAFALSAHTTTARLRTYARSVWTAVLSVSPLGEATHSATPSPSKRSKRRTSRVHSSTCPSHLSPASPPSPFRVCCKPSDIRVALLSPHTQHSQLRSPPFPPTPPPKHKPTQKNPKKITPLNLVRHRALQSSRSCCSTVHVSTTSTKKCIISFSAVTTPHLPPPNSPFPRFPRFPSLPPH